MVKGLADIDWAAIIEKLNMPSTGLVIFGGFALLIAIYVNNLLGLKVSLITLVIGCVFKLFSNTTEAIQTVWLRTDSFGIAVLYVVFQILVWIWLTLLYIFLINNQVHIL